LGEIDAEIATMRAVIDGLVSTDQQLAQTLACAVGAYHDATHEFAAGITELADLVQRLSGPTPVRPVLLATLADLHLRRGDHAEASRLLTVASELRDEVGVPSWAAVAIERTSGEVLLRGGDLAGAARLAREVLERELGLADSARMWNLLGIALLSAGELAESEVAFRHELDAYVALDVDTKVASANGNVAELALRRGDTAGAAQHQLASLDAALVIGQPVMLSFSAVVAAHLAGRMDEWAMAVRLQSAAAAGLAAAGHRLYDSDADELERLRSTAATHLHSDELAAETATGAALDPVRTAALTRRILEQVIAHGVDRTDLQPTDDEQETP
jgi:hypothetical protein